MLLYSGGIHSFRGAAASTTSGGGGGREEIDG